MKFVRVMTLAFIAVGSISLSASDTKLVIGASAPEMMSAYYTASVQSVEAVETKLKAQGFTVLAITKPLKKDTVLTITNTQLQATNSFVATLNVQVGENEVRVQNPSYFASAYLQDKYKYGQLKATLTALESALGDLHTVKEVLETSRLPKFQFMMGMPYVDDTITVGEGTGLVAKLKENKYVSYSLKLPNGSTLVGHKLIRRTNKFLKKIKAQGNALLLPYTSIITGETAVILDPKYYLALSLPLLSMGEFMKISSAPGEIEKDVKRTFK